MRPKHNLLLAMLIVAFASFGQSNFTYTPANPKPGDAIEITYVPAGDLASTPEIVQGLYYVYTPGRRAEDLALTKKGKKYVATIQTASTNTFVQLSFFVKDTYDHNSNKGYYIPLSLDGKPVKGSLVNQAFFYEYYCSDSGFEKQTDKAIAALEKEFELYPEQKSEYGSPYFSMVMSVDDEKGKALIEKEIERVKTAGMEQEKDYAYLRGLYTQLKMRDEAAAVYEEIKTKFPDGTWSIPEKINVFMREPDASNKAALFTEIENNISSGDEKWERYKGNLNYFRSSVIQAFGKAKDWQTVRQMTAAMEDKNEVAKIYNSLAWGLQEKQEDLELASEFSALAVAQARENLNNPTGERPAHLAGSQWGKVRANTLAMFLDTYAMVLYRLGQHAEGYTAAKEAAIDIKKGDDPNYNDTYALLAEKVLSPAELKAQLEQFVRQAKSGDAVQNALRKLYVSEKGSEEGYDLYIADLGREEYLRMVEKLRESMLNDSAPEFALKDLEGKTVSLADLKGKVVVIDFWATWCGPCKASFPGMQKLVDKFTNDNNVAFLFIDTWEQAKDKETNAQDFITANNYTFHVLMDNDNKVVGQFKVDGIPAKFVLDKQGNIRFKSVGYGGSNDHLINELTAMIELAAGEKTF